MANRHGIPLHLDGARIWNAAVAQGIQPRELAAPADSLSVCFSKGLACPVGSIVVGSKAFVDDARRNRKLVGGAMRQVGVLAAAALVAIDEMIDRLAEDHANARLLAERMHPLPGIEFDLATVETNIVRFNYTGPAPEQFVQRVKERGVLMTGSVSEGLRVVTHYGITEADVRRATEVFETVVMELAGKSAVAVTA